MTILTREDGDARPPHERRDRDTGSVAGLEEKQRHYVRGGGTLPTTSSGMVPYQVYLHAEQQKHQPLGEQGKVTDQFHRQSILP